MIRITKNELMAMKPCNPESRSTLFGRHKYMDVRLALKAGVSISDILWVAGRFGHQALCIEFALTCAQRVAANDPTGAARRCIDATRAYAADPSTANLKFMKSARSAAAWSESAAARSAARSAAEKRELAFQNATLIKLFGGK